VGKTALWVQIPGDKDAWSTYLIDLLQAFIKEVPRGT
jgi:hypothetical protein